MTKQQVLKQYFAWRGHVGGSAGKGACKRRGDSSYYARIGKKGGERTAVTRFGKKPAEPATVVSREDMGFGGEYI
jgi:hypothetical protein